MSLVKTWYTPEELESKYGVGQERLMEWIEDGLVRCEREGEKIIRVNVDDVKLELDSMSRRT